MFLILFNRNILIIHSVIVMFVVPDCSLSASECTECSGESPTDCLRCSYGFSLIAPGYCFSKEKDNTKPAGIVQTPHVGYLLHTFTNFKVAFMYIA